MKTQLFHITVFYQCIVGHDAWPIDITYQVNAKNVDEAHNKVIKNLYERELKEDPDLDLDYETFKDSVTIYPKHDDPDKPQTVYHAEEEGYCIQSVKLITL